MSEPAGPESRILRLRDVETLTGRKRSSIYEDIAAGRMPRPLKLGPRAVGWLRSDIDAWLAERIAERATGPTWPEWRPNHSKENP